MLVSLSFLATGMSMFMVMGWLVGDIFKTGYFIFLNQPFQFVLCGSLQVTVDCLIICQVKQQWLSEKENGGDSGLLLQIFVENDRRSGGLDRGKKRKGSLIFTNIAQVNNFLFS